MYTAILFHMLCDTPYINLLLTLGAHAQEGYGIFLVCVSVCYHSIGNIHRFYAENEIHVHVRRDLS